MSARLLDGTRLAQQLRSELLSDVAALTALGRRPGLGVVLAGDNPASASYVRSKERACTEAGVHSETARLPLTSTTEELLAQVEAYNQARHIHGILVQLPLPPQVDATRVLDRVAPYKDVDGFHPENVGLLVQRRPRFVACTPAGILELLQRERVPLAGARAVVLGRSDIVGKPMALLLMHADATVTVCHSRTRDLEAVTREADLLIAAIGRAGFVRPAHVKPGAVVIDVGINSIVDASVARDLLPPARWEAFERNGRALVGDVHPSVASVASALTPVPGGVGPLTIALLLKNTVQAARLAEVP